MKKTVLLILALLIIFPSQKGFGWGFFAHKKINRMAVFTLPPEMFTFYKKNIEFITEHAIDPDKRRYTLVEEASKHYIDIDHYGENPFEMMPRKWNDAVEKFSEDTLKAYGIVPWHINLMVSRLTKAFRNKDYERILRYSTDLGHYVGDSNVPLHTTENYNGQLTGQKGIHEFWESRIPELKHDEYDYWTGKAKYVDSPLNYTWDIIEESHAAVDTVLLFEDSLTQIFPSDQKYSYETRGTTIVKVYSEEFSTAYNDMLDGMVEKRMINSIISVGSLWYTAWVNAGQPNLTEIKKKVVSEEYQKQLKKEDESFEQNKIKGREHQY